MIVTKHISLDEHYIKKLEPFVQRHEGNFSSAIRELIEKSNRSTVPNNSIAINISLFEWLLKEIDGRLIPEDVLDLIIDPSLMHRIEDFEKYINKMFSELDWSINVDIDADNKSAPSNIIVNVVGNTPDKVRLISSMISQYIIKNSSDSNPFAIKSVISLNNGTKVELSKTGNKKEGLDSLITFFGNFEEVAKAIHNKSSFWKCIVNRHVISNYNMVTIHRNYFEDILAGNIPMGEIMIETIAKKPVTDIPPREMLGLIKQVYEASRAVDKVEIRDGHLILFHSFRNRDAIEKLKRSLIMLLEANGHLYDGKLTTNMIVLTHMPDVGIKINEIVNNLKSSDSKFDQELMLFMTFIKGLENVSDTPMSISILGRRIGIALMKEYEKENSVNNWNLEIFKRAFEMIDSKIHRESELKLEGKDLLYRIRKCAITKEGDTFDAYVCRTAREAFKGALEHAFGHNAELGIKKLISHGDSYCEVVIRLL